MINKISNWFLLVLLFLTLSSFFDFNQNNEKDKLLIEIISYVIERGHFDPKNIDNEFSENMFKEFIENMDGQHRFFLSSDIGNFKKYKYDLDDQIINSKTTFFDLVYNKLIQRQEIVKNFYEEILNKPFSFNEDEIISLDYKNAPYPTTLNDLKFLWRKRLKLSTLSIYVDKKEDQINQKKIDSSHAILDDYILEKQSREITLSNMKNFFDSVDELNRNDYFNIYINSLVKQFDPHSFYFSPNEKETFDTSISGKFEGIGARLGKKNQQITILEVISGGPVWKGNLLEPGDVILKVSDSSGDPVEVTGMRLDDVVKLIKGPKGTNVILNVKRVDGTVNDVNIVRDIVELEESYAKASIIKKNEINYGLIYLPKFYVDFKSYNERNAANDVKKLIIQLKKEKINGLVLDLRDNGGGSLQTVVDITGYFIKTGPVVQVKSTGGKKQVLRDRDPSIIWNGPLVVLVNELSASASEILAAALQDYNRAIVIGSKQTFGKGTVQNVVDLNKIIAGNSYGNLGALKLTTDKFYRINGGSTQLEGVKSDIIFPNRYSFIEIGEKDQENPLPWDFIGSAQFSPSDTKNNFEYVQNESNKRIVSNTYLNLLKEEAKWVKEQQDQYKYSLNYSEFVRNRDSIVKISKKFDKIGNYRSDLTIDWIEEDRLEIDANNSFKEKRARWKETLIKDIQLNEAINILSDIVQKQRAPILASSR
ncbi:MAG: carboxy terminal-processing peptidase [Bacteroidota bacterium]|nr:carboxy terminal-processing peptidase [Bacteroidota bacterium]|tara:strand:+ start:1175 stop:3295 length:2121 start_codon:yes stop_codon:yes gene_type:complete